MIHGVWGFGLRINACRRSPMRFFSVPPIAHGCVGDHAGETAATTNASNFHGKFVEMDATVLGQ